MTYEALANYLDIELPQQQLSTHNFQPLPPQQQQRTLKSKTYPQFLLPKITPAMTTEEIAKELLFSSSVSSDLMNIPNTLVNINNNASKPSSDSKPIAKDPAEEDKRKRNTAASARFRIKKKQREQTLEKTVRDMTEKSTGLENRVRELELEIKFLKGLLIEKDLSKPAEPANVKDTVLVA